MLFIRGRHSLNKQDSESRFTGRFWCAFHRLFIYCFFFSLRNDSTFRGRYAVLIFAARWSHNFREITVRNSEKSKIVVCQRLDVLYNALKVSQFSRQVAPQESQICGENFTKRKKTAVEFVSHCPWRDDAFVSSQYFLKSQAVKQSGPAFLVHPVLCRLPVNQYAEILFI